LNDDSIAGAKPPRGLNRSRRRRIVGHSRAPKFGARHLGIGLAGANIRKRGRNKRGTQSVV